MSENNEPLTVNNTSSEKLVPVGEAIRYRKRAQAAEKELEELKVSHQKQDDELTSLKEQLEAVQDGRVSDRPGESGTVRTQGVKEARATGTRSVLQNAARQAAGSGSRADVQEYLRLRRNFL